MAQHKHVRSYAETQISAQARSESEGSYAGASRSIDVLGEDAEHAQEQGTRHPRAELAQRMT